MPADWQLGLLHEPVPKASRIAVLINPANASTTEAIFHADLSVQPSTKFKLVINLQAAIALDVCRRS